MKMVLMKSQPTWNLALCTNVPGNCAVTLLITSTDVN